MTHPAGSRPTVRPSWYKAAAGVLVGCIMAGLVISGVNALFAFAGVDLAGVRSVPAVAYGLFAAVVTALSVRFFVERVAWRVLPFPIILAVCLLSSVLWLDRNVAWPGGLLLLAALTALVRYRSIPDDRSFSSVGIRA